MRWTHLARKRKVLLVDVNPRSVTRARSAREPKKGRGTMQLYFTPLSCSMATRICLYEAGAQASFIEVDTKTKRTPDGADYHQVNPLGLVPTVRTDQGTILSENAAILQYVARRHPDAKLAPNDDVGLASLQQWLCFIGTELHKGLFTPLLDASAPDGAKSYALSKGEARLALLNSHLTGREYLLDAFSVADAYLVTVLNWTIATSIDLKRFPALSAYAARMRARPSVAKAIAEERVFYQAQQSRHQAA
jgi:glutathione S-transferase